jgi:tRNA threonylcarbamoyladenosine biosynthesis protein TsaB
LRGVSEDSTTTGLGHGTAGDTTLRTLLLDAADRLGGPLLGLDTSGPVTSLCTVGWRPGEVWEATLTGGSLPSEQLAAALADRLASAAIAAHDLRGIVIGTGPGSFTGLRVGLATAKGLAFGARVPLVGVSSLAVLAASAGPGRVGPVVDARQGEVFSALYDVGPTRVAIARVEDAARTPEAFARAMAQAGAPPSAQGTLLVGDFAARCVLLPGFADARVGVCTPRIGCGILAAAARLAAGDVDALEPLAPRYLRASEAERQLARGATEVRA